MSETLPRYAVITTTGGATVNISDHTKALYSNIILSWQPITSTHIDPINFTSIPASCSFSVANNITINAVSRFTKITGLVFADIKIYQSSVLIFWGTIEDIVNIGNVDVTIQCIGKDADLSKLFQCTIVDKTAFPYAAIDDIGKMLPIVYGAAKRVPFMGIEIGASTVLKAAIAWDTSYINIVDASSFPSSGMVDIDNERISYSSKAGDDGNTLVVLSRGEEGTEVVGHDIGSVVREVRDEYIYAIDGSVSAIGDIYVGDYKLLSDAPVFGVTVTRYLGDHPTYQGLACIGVEFFKAVTGSVGGLVSTNIYDTLIYPIATIPDVPYAYDGKRDTFYNSAEDSYNVSPSSPGYEPAKRFISFECPGGHAENSKWPEGVFGAAELHILIDMDSGSSPENKKVIINQTADTYTYLTEWDDFWNYHAMDTEIDLSENEGCPTWHKVIIIDGPFCPYITVLWDDIEGTEVRIYEFHIKLIPLEEEETEDPCYPVCDFCPVDEDPLSSDRGISGTSASKQAARGVQKNTDIGGVQTPPTDFQWDRIYADVSGKTDGASPPSVIESPEDIITDIITVRCGLTITKTHDATGYVEAFAILQKPDVRALLANIAYQAKCISFFTPAAHILKQMTGTYSTDAVIANYSGSPLVFDPDMFQNQAYLNYTNKSYIANKIDSLFNFQWWGKYNGADTVTAEDADSPSSQDVYGEIQLSDNLPYVASEVQAQAVIDWRLDWLKRPRLMIEFIGTLTNNINRKIGDVITIDTTDVDIDAMLAELVESTDEFLILGIVYQPDGAIRITAIGL